eukprot:13249948-Alexandrium_andersonii.AAC.1
MVSPSFAGSSLPGARIVNYHEDPGCTRTRTQASTALSPMPGVAQRSAVVYLLSPADGRAYTASLLSYYACD